MKILIAGYYGFGNLGDELILSSVLSQLKARYPGSMMTVLSANPPQTEDIHSVKAVPRWSPFSAIRQLWANDCFILGGGGLIQNRTSHRSLIYYMGLILLARVMDCPVILYAMGVEHLEGRFARWLVKMALDSDNVKITVRDDASKHILLGLGLPESHVFVTADPVFARFASAPAKERYSFQPYSILLIPRFPCPPTGRRVFSLISHILREEKGLSVQGLLFQPKAEQPYLANFNGASILSEEDFIWGLSFEQMASEVGKFDWVVSARFHGCVLAALAGRPFIGVGDPEKVGRLCDALKMPFLPWNADDATIRAVMEKAIRKSLSVETGALQHWRDASLRTASFLG
jgi:polysaccharide pyruvyl transferase CsaB